MSAVIWSADEHLISERGRSLIIAAAVLERANIGEPDDDIAILARQLTRAQEEIDELKRDLKHLRVISP